VEAKAGYFMEKDDLVRLVQDFRADCHDGFVSNDSSYIEAWLRGKPEIAAPDRGAYYLEGYAEETAGVGKGIQMDPEGGEPIAPAYEKDPEDYSMSTKVILGIYVAAILGFSVLAFLEHVCGVKFK
jgi:hypothetical protein